MHTSDTTAATPTNGVGMTPRPANAPAPTAWDKAITQEWPAVHIDQVEVQRATDCATLAVVRAHVFLGRLLPPDVNVELTREEESESPRANVTTDRMWTSRAYDNGSYLFEAHVPIARVVSARRMAVHVCPARLTAGADAGACAECVAEVSLTRMRTQPDAAKATPSAPGQDVGKSPAAPASDRT